ncbi:hypothetical protein RGUI_0546 [Rhodovulum sp. P5]|nr:hypothetical protein RGUI_0546 [Rhodovulum sp. P5]
MVSRVPLHTLFLAGRLSPPVLGWSLGHQRKTKRAGGCFRPLLVLFYGLAALSTAARIQTLRRNRKGLALRPVMAATLLVPLPPLRPVGRPRWRQRWQPDIFAQVVVELPKPGVPGTAAPVEQRHKRRAENAPRAVLFDHAGDRQRGDDPACRPVCKFCHFDSRMS